MSRSARSWRSARALAAIVVLAAGLGWWISVQRRTPAADPAPPPAPTAAMSAVEPLEERLSPEVQPARQAVAGREPDATQARAAAMPASYAVRVRVTDLRGAPVCGASVQLLLENPDSVTDHARAKWQAVATTGRDGIAARELSLEDLTRGPMDAAGPGRAFQVVPVDPVPAGFTRVSLWAKRPGYGDVRKEFLLDLAVQPPELALELDRGLMLFGRVHTADGTPVVGASLFPWLQGVRTDERGEILGTETCEGVEIRSPGVAGWRTGQEVELAIRSRNPVFEDYRTKFVFARANVDLDIVLRRTKRFLVTVVDCATGEPIHGPRLQLMTWTHRDGRPQHFANESAESSGVLKDVELFLRARDGTHAVLLLEQCLGNSFVLPTAADERIGDEALPLQVCVRRLKPVVLRGKTLDGAEVGRFRFGVTVNRLSEPWGSDIDIDAGQVADASFLAPALFSIFYLQERGRDPPIETIELTRIRCVVPDLRTGSLTDEGGRALTLPIADYVETGTLSNPISLLAGAWPASEPVPVETLTFVVVPPGK